MSDRASRPLVARNAVGVGLAALIPLPWVDEWARRRLNRASFRAAAQDAGVALSAQTIDRLVRDQGSLLWGLFVAVLIWPIKKLFRTIFYFLTIKDVLDWTTEAAIRAEMIHMAAVSGALPERVDEVRRHMDEVLERHRYSPVTRWLFGGARPALDWPGGSVTLLGGVGTLVRWGGGGVILAAFAERLAQPPEGRSM